MLYTYSACSLALALLYMLSGISLQAEVQLYTHFDPIHSSPRTSIEMLYRSDAKDTTTFLRASFLFKELNDGEWCFVMDGSVETQTSEGFKRKPLFCAMTINPYCQSSSLLRLSTLFNIFFAMRLEEVYKSGCHSTPDSLVETFDELKASVERARKMNAMCTPPPLEEFPSELKAILEEFIYLIRLTSIVEVKTSRQAFTSQLLELQDKLLESLEKPLKQVNHFFFENKPAAEAFREWSKNKENTYVRL